MASGVLAPPGLTQGAPSSSDAQSHEIAEYEKIIRLHDEILAGTHPRLKIPASLAGKLATSTVPKAASTSSPRPAAAEPQVQRITSPNLYTQHAVFKETLGSSKAAQIVSKPNVTQAVGHRVPLSIPEDPAKADIRAKRERLEAVLREKLERRQKEAKHRPRPQDVIPDFEIGEVLERALAIVQHVAPPAASDSSMSNTPKSDFFDENSYYSSQHDSPAPRTDDDAMDTRPDGLQAAEAMPAAEAVQADDRPVQISQELPLREQQPPQDTTPTNAGAKATSKSPQINPPTSHSVQGQDVGTEAAIRHDEASPGIQQGLFGGGETAMVIVVESNPAVPADPTQATNPALSISHPESINSAPEPTPLQELQAKRSPDLRKRVAQMRSDHQAEQRHEGVSRSSPEVPIIRSHIRSPLAPQPARVSPLAVARRPAAGLERRSHAESLSRPFSSLHSPESPPAAPEALPPSKRRRVRDHDEPRHAPVRRVRESPLREIKQEPVSPGPFSVIEERPPLIVERAPRYHESDRSRGHNEALVIHTNTSFHSPSRYERFFPETPSTTHVPPGYRQESVDRSRKHRADFQRYASFQVSRRQQSPPSYQIYSPTESHPFRAASHSVFERPGRSNVRYVREEMGPPRTHYIRSERSRSPVYERRSPPGRSPVLIRSASRAPLPNYTIHEDGSRLVEVPSSAHGRHSVAPSAYPVYPDSRLRDSDPYVEQVHVPVRMSDNPFSDRGYIEHRAPSPRVMRRVIDEPSERTEFMTYRPREYATRPSGVIVPREEYVYTREVPERRPRSRYEEVVIPREYIERRPVSPRAYVEQGLPSPRVYEHQPARQYEVEPGLELERLHGGSATGIGGGPSSEAGYPPAPVPPPPARRVDVFQPGNLHQEYHTRADDERRREREYEYVPAPPAPQPHHPAHHQHPPPPHPAERYTYIAEPPPPPGGRRYVNEVRYIESPRDRGAPEISEEGWRRASYRY